METVSRESEATVACDGVKKRDMTYPADKTVARSERRDVSRPHQGMSAGRCLFRPAPSNYSFQIMASTTRCRMRRCVPSPDP
jgi:hypothetical protein